MDDRGARTTRRSLLALGAGTALAAGAAGSAVAAGSRLPGRAEAAGSGLAEAGAGLRKLEREHGVRLGVFAHHTVTGHTLRHRADERFPMCSAFKPLAVAAVLRDLDHDGTFLARRIRYTEADTEKAGYAPLTGLAYNLADGMTVAALCSAAIAYSDNAAANLLMRELGGPAAVTRFCRSTGDEATRLDRWEPELNSAEPDRVTDTTTPRAIGRTYQRLVLGKALDPADRERLTGWLLDNTTSGKRLRAGLPAGWILADKTGTGAYGTAHDVGVAWSPGGSPVVLSVLTTHRDAGAPADEALIARVAALAAGALG
ncbi:class A beta-lactamase [Streptomyces sp. LP05-1]|uniref:Beta-lactamase n=1 Tax=Streptomyces pyxinae TaxID=2970734 RepID=A0ABT2CH58_9ACTN|nr:class A beta-lactamase [Streptomyces sp. LP05-1]MCS0636723.1 class A beta-lactamase [Streptomyces sp. LP05-1]